MAAEITSAYERFTLSTLHSFLQRKERTVSTCSKVVSYSHDAGNDGPVLVLLHGYPQSAYLWRHVAASLKDTASLFIPELPGYGISDPPKGELTFASMGNAILEAFHAEFPSRDLILIGHDRGARIAHRLAIDYSHGGGERLQKILGCALFDIVPTLEQWKAFSSAVNVTRYFHWPFLASPVAADMIKAYGGDKWTEIALDRIGGSNPDGRRSFTSDNSWDVYKSVFATAAAIDGSCADYKAGSLHEPPLQEAEQRAGKKLEIPTLVGWSVDGLGKAHGDVGQIWELWMKSPDYLYKVPIGDDVGHYLAEEAPEQVSEAIKAFTSRIGG